MSDSKRVTRNVVCNCAGIGVEMLAGFLIAPFLIHRLGDTAYGLWIVVGSLTSYFGLLDLGVRGSVGRYVAFYHARDDRRGVNETLSTAFALLAGVGLVAFIGVLATLPLFFRLFDVPAEHADAVRVALVVVGLNLGLSFLVNAFDATLWGFQRFDLLNAVDIPASLARTGLTLFCVSRGGGLVSLAVITLSVTVGSGLAKATLSFRESRTLRLGARHVNRRALREIFGYSIWSFIGSVTRITRAQLSPLLIGSLLGVAVITPFAIASRLVNYVILAMQSGTGVLTPLATALHAQNNEDRQRQLFTVGSKFCCALSLYLTTLLVLLGKPLITLWVGPNLLAAVPLLVVLALGELLPNAQYVTNGMIFAAARHRALAYLSVLEVLLVGLGTVLLLRPLGPLGACYAVAVPGVLCRGVSQVILGCRLTKLSMVRYVGESLLPALACAVLPALALAAAVAWRPVETWTNLVAYGTGYSLLFALSLVPLIGYGQMKRLATNLLRRARPSLQPSVVES